MPQSNVRVVGSAFTTLRWMGNTIAYLESFTDSGVTPIAQAQEITPLDSLHPQEFVTPRAMTSGSLTFTVRELWDKPVWQHFPGLENTETIVDIWETIASMPDAITCQMIIKPPNGNVWRTKTYHNVLITSVDTGENVNRGALSLARSVEAAYTHFTLGTLTPDQTG